MSKNWLIALSILGLFILGALFFASYLSKFPEKGILLSPEENITHELELQYTFDALANGITPDLSPFRRYGLVTNGQLANSIIGPVMQFNGNHFVNVTGSDIDPGSAFTISAWIKLSNPVNKTPQLFETILSDKVGSAPASISIYLDSALNKTNISVQGDNSSRTVSSNSPLVSGNWYHIVAKMENDSLGIYINGTLDNEANFSGITPYDSNRSFTIGSTYGSGGFLYGSLKDLRIYNRALSEEEITYLADKNNIPSPTESNAPSINLISPANNALVNSSNISFIANLTDDVLLVNATFYLWNSTSIINTTTFVTPGFSYLARLNRTISYAGDFVWGIAATDSDGQTSLSNASFSYDKLAPLISFTYPLNRTYNDSVNSLRFSSSDSHLETCRYSTNNGITNNTIACNQETTNVFATNGNHRWIGYVNDTSGNSNFSKVAFAVDDITPPKISVQTPGNTSYPTPSILFRIKLNEPSYASFSIDNGNSFVMNSEDNKTFVYLASNLSSGSHRVAFYTSDMQQNDAESSVTFTIAGGTIVNQDFGETTLDDTVTENESLDENSGLNENQEEFEETQNPISGNEESSQSKDSANYIFWTIVILIMLCTTITAIIIIVIVIRNRKQESETQQETQ